MGLGGTWGQREAAGLDNKEERGTASWGAGDADAWRRMEEVRPLTLNLEPYVIKSIQRLDPRLKS